MLAQIPMKEFGQAEQVADLTVFLAGQDYLTGQVVAIDGGLNVAEARGKKMKLNRVVVTGYGVTSPIGNTPEEFWNGLTTGKIGIGPITKFDHSDFDVHNAAEIQDFPFDKYFVKKDTNRFDNYSLYALYAAQEAVNHAGLDVETLDKDRFGVIVASGIGGIKEIEDQVLRLNDKGPKRVKPLTLPKALPNMASGNVAMRFGANGVCKSINTACASSNDAIGDAFRSIKFGFQDVMLVGGSEASITPLLLLVSKP